MLEQLQQRVARRRGGVIMVIAAALCVAVVIWASVLLASAWHANRAARATFPSSFRTSVSQESGADNATSILLVGTDLHRGRALVGHADSIMILRLSDSSDDASMLSIPRNLAVRAPDGHDEQIARLMSVGGVPLIVRTIEQQLDVPIDHVMHVDIERLARVIDAVGGVDVVNPAPVRNIGYHERTWEFPKGPLHLEPDEAIAFARIRTNELNPRESDSSRALRQQLVVSALARSIYRPATLAQPRRVGTLVRAVRTDMNLLTLSQIGWRVRAQLADGAIRNCRIGGAFRGMTRARATGLTTTPEFARPFFVLVRPGVTADPWLLDQAADSAKVVQAFQTDGAQLPLRGATSAYPRGCQQASL